MPTLRKQLIRLAYENPQMQEKLLPLLKEGAVMSEPLDRALRDILRKAYIAGTEAGFVREQDEGDEFVRTAGRESLAAYKEVKHAIAKLEPKNWGRAGTLGGVPIGTLKNLSAALWELAYWNGAFQGPSK